MQYFETDSAQFATSVDGRLWLADAHLREQHQNTGSSSKI